MSDSASVKSRVVGAILGSLVADAAVHAYDGIADTDEVQAIVGDNAAPEFPATWHNPLCEEQTGELSCYGMHSYIMMETIVENKGLNLDAYKEKLKKTFGRGSIFDKSAAQDENAENRRKAPYLFENLEDAVQALESGEERTFCDDMIFDCCISLVPVVSFYAGSGAVCQRVEEVVRITVNNDVAVQAAQVYAQILEYFILNGLDPENVMRQTKKLPYRDEFRDIIHEGKHVLKFKKIPQHIYVSKIGNGTALPVCFMAVIHALVCTINFVDGVRAEIRGGGSVCLRAGLIGACLAAQFGEDCIPGDWIKKTTDNKWYRKMAVRLADSRPEDFEFLDDLSSNHVIPGGKRNARRLEGRICHENNWR